jgi:hypothetical protein
MWRYRQRTGELSKDGHFVSSGYSGKGRGKNNPALEGVKGVGPIPTGFYKIGSPYNSKRVGPFALPLEPVDNKMGDDTHERTGRGAFRMHGDSVSHPGEASNGCIIMPRVIRERVYKSKDVDLKVVE